MKPRYTSEFLPWAYFLREGIARLRGGGNTVAFNIQGPGHETTSDDDVLAACERFGKSLGLFGTGDFLHLIVYRIAATEYPKRTFPNAAAAMVDQERREQFNGAKYFRNICECWWSNQDEYAIANYLKALFFASTEHQMRGSRENQLDRFLHRVEKWQDAMSSTLRPRRMSSLEMFRSLILAVNGTPYDAPMPASGAALHHLIGQQDWVGGSTPKVGQLHVRPVTLVHPWPTHTTEQALSILLRHPGEMMLSCRFICLDQPDAERVLKLEQKHFFREQNGTGIKQWFFNAFKVQKRANNDEDIEKQIQECNHALALLADGTPFGWASIVAEVRGRDGAEVNSRARQMVKDLADIGHGARIEDAGAMEAKIGSLPGQGFSNVRRPLISGPNFGEIAMPAHHWEGTRQIDSQFFPKGTPAPLIVTGTGIEPFHVPSHIRSVGHTLIIGPTTGGKSTLLAAIIVALVVLPNVRIVWLDRDYSSFVLTHAMGGTHIELAADNSSALCPFQWMDQEADLSWLYDFFVRIFHRWAIELNERQSAELMTALELARASGIHTMTGFMHVLQDRQLRGVIRNYTAEQQWGHIFDGEPVDRTDQMLTTYEMRRLDILSELGLRAAAPATELIIHDAEVGLGTTPTFVIADEAKWILASPVSRAWIDKALRTFRKYNAAIILATQSVAEVDNSEVRSILLESTPIKIFLPNRAARGESVRTLYQQLELTEKEIEIIAAAIPQRDYLCSTEYGTRLFRLDLGPVARALCASTGANDVARARAILEEFQSGAFLDAWLHEGGLGPAPQRPLERFETLPAYANGRIEEVA